jgi:16S rRNA (cytidine1402-2'-O)-methyltransferase
MPTGTLYIVGTPIGNPDDIGARAQRVLSEVEIIACEEHREALRLLKHLGIEKPLIEVNEHTEQEATGEVIGRLRRGASCALISDCGMPVFADPGTQLVNDAYEAGIRVAAVPGPTSLTAALTLCGFDIRRFHFQGFLSPKREIRQKELRTLRQLTIPLVLMDTPYRLIPLLDDCLLIFSPDRQCCVAADLTMPGERIVRGSLKEVHEYFSSHKDKREYVLIIDAPLRRGQIRGPDAHRNR